jgi:hypothetical protein
MTDVKDWRGKPIEVGCVIVYATTASSSIYMNEAIVAEIDFVQETRYRFNDDPVTKQRVRTPYLVERPFLRVRKTIEHSYGTNSNADQRKLQKLTRVDRVTVVAAPDWEKCNFMGCTADSNHTDINNPDRWPAHSFERD